MARRPADRERRQALKEGLKALFRRLQDRPVPDRIRSVADQLDETTPTEGRKSG